MNRPSFWGPTMSNAIGNGYEYRRCPGCFKPFDPLEAAMLTFRHDGGRLRFRVIRHVRDHGRDVTALLVMWRWRGHVRHLLFAFRP